MAGSDWTRHGEFEDIAYETTEGVAKLTICRPEVRNAFRPQTLNGLSRPSTSRGTTPRSG